MKSLFLHELFIMARNAAIIMPKIADLNGGRWMRGAVHREMSNKKVNERMDEDRLGWHMCTQKEEGKTSLEVAWTPRTQR